MFLTLKFNVLSVSQSVNPVLVSETTPKPLQRISWTHLAILNTLCRYVYYQEIPIIFYDFGPIFNIEMNGL